MGYFVGIKDGDLEIKYNVAGDIKIIDDGGLGIFIKDGGDVGIGTDSPTAKLHVVGNINVTGTVDGRDVSADGTKLDGIASGATVGATWGTNINNQPSQLSHINANEGSKLSGIEENADVTDATNVAAAGAIMDGDFTSNGFMKRTGAGSYDVAADGSYTDFTVVVDCRMYEDEFGHYIMEKKTRALTLDNGLITDAGNESAWIEVGNITP